jgi:predicted DNA-binding transcriptional regulator AlpA
MKQRIEEALRNAAKAAAVPGERGLDMYEAAVKLGISESSLRRLMAAGKVPKRRVLDGRPMFLASELDAYLLNLPVEEEPPGRPTA